MYICDVLFAQTVRAVFATKSFILLKLYIVYGHFEKKYTAHFKNTQGGKEICDMYSVVQRTMFHNIF